MDITTTAADSSDDLYFGLAVYRELMSATYPAISTHGGAIWRIDGPGFYGAAAEGPAITSSVGALGAEGAYFSGRGGEFIHVTTDEGVHWWTTTFVDGVTTPAPTMGPFVLLRSARALGEGLHFKPSSTHRRTREGRGPFSVSSAMCGFRSRVCVPAWCRSVAPESYGGGAGSA